MNKVSLAGNGNLPLANGIKHLYGNLYLVPFKSIQIAIEAADPKASKYSFTNPRLLTEKGQKSLTNKESSARLRNDIKNHGLMHPFVCIWLEKDGEIGKDDLARGEKELEKVTSEHVSKIDELLKHKEAELLEV